MVKLPVVGVHVNISEGRVLNCVVQQALDPTGSLRQVGHQARDFLDHWWDQDSQAPGDDQDQQGHQEQTRNPLIKVKTADTNLHHHLEDRVQHIVKKPGQDQRYEDHRDEGQKGLEDELDLGADEDQRRNDEQDQWPEQPVVEFLTRHIKPTLTFIIL